MISKNLADKEWMQKKDDPPKKSHDKNTHSDAMHEKNYTIDV